jgi:ribonucleotide monophosphatase NagD (HAD superfamily)
MFYHRIRDEFHIDVMNLTMSSSFSSLKSAGNPESPHHLPHEQITQEVQEQSHKMCVITSAYTCAWYCKLREIKKPFVIAHGTGLLDELEHAGITDYFATVDRHGKHKPEFMATVSVDSVEAIVNKAPKEVDAIIVGWDHNLSALTIAVAENFLRWNEELGRGKIPIITCSSDLGGIVGRINESFPKKDFRGLKIRTIGNGMMANAICHRSTKREQEYIPIDVGKPSQMFKEHLSRPIEEGGLDINFQSAVMVGDNLETDVKLANNSGMSSLLVLSGVTSRRMVQEEDRPDCKPTWIMESLADLYP